LILIGAAKVRISSKAANAQAIRDFVLDANSVYWDSENELLSFSQIKQQGHFDGSG
jgi:hypothetical protein